jgi:ATP-binding cassette subfamily B protein
MDATLAWLLVIVIPVMAIVIAAIISRAIPQFRSMQAKIDTVNRVMREQLTGIRVIRAFVRTSSEQRRFAAANADLTATALTVNRLFALMMPALMLIMNLSSVAIIWFGGLRVDSGEMPIGNLTAFLTYMTQILFAVMMATMMFVMVPRAAASAERVRAVLDVIPELSDPSVPRSPGRHVPAGRVELRGAEFRYPGAEASVLVDVTLTAEPGQTTAVVGSTGSGKSTLVNLIPRLYDVSGGSVLVDGVDVREMSRLDLWSRIGLVPQRAFLFGGTVASNLRVGRSDASDEDLWAALEVAQAADFVRALPEGINEPVDQGGVNFSGGQRQRLAIARAIVRHPDVYVFDDSFSALDYATDARLRAALRQRTSRATVIVVAQRVATIMHADRIVVLDGGRLVGSGRHHELMDTCETYREIVLSQLTAEEAT